MRELTRTNDAINTEVRETLRQTMLDNRRVRESGWGTEVEDLTESQIKGIISYYEEDGGIKLEHLLEDWSAGFNDTEDDASK